MKAKIIISIILASLLALDLLVIIMAKWVFPISETRDKYTAKEQTLKVQKIGYIVAFAILVLFLLTNLIF